MYVRLLSEIVTLTIISDCGDMFCYNLGVLNPSDCSVNALTSSQDPTVLKVSIHVTLSPQQYLAPKPEV